jgi:hypothetical protein
MCRAPARFTTRRMQRLRSQQEPSAGRPFPADIARARQDRVACLRQRGMTAARRGLQSVDHSEKSEIQLQIHARRNVPALQGLVHGEQIDF